MLGYLKKVIEKLKEAGKSEEEIKKFQAGVQGYYTKKLVPMFDELDFYTGETLDPDGMCVVSPVNLCSLRLSSLLTDRYLGLCSSTIARMESLLMSLFGNTA